MKVFYFGCKGDKGHYLFDREEGSYISSYQADKILPFKYYILDGQLYPPNESQIQSKPYFSIINGYSIISCWDRTVDSRPGSNSSFIVEGVHTMEETMRIAKEKFPITYKRIYGEA